MSDNRKLMISMGVVHIIIGVAQPLLWGISWVFAGYYSRAVAEVWGGVLFFIPTGILAILASSGRKQQMVIGCLIMSSLSDLVAILIAVTAGLAAGANFSDGYVAHGVFSVLAIVLGLVELGVAIMTTTMSRKIMFLNSSQAQQAATIQATTVAYPGTGYPGTNYPGPPQYPPTGMQVQPQYPGAQAPPQYPPTTGMQVQPQYPGAQPPPQYHADTKPLPEHYPPAPVDQQY